MSSKSAIAGPGWYVRSARSALLVLEGEPQLGAVSDATVAVDMNVLFDNSATLRSRSVSRAVFTAAAAASSHDWVLVPIAR